MEIAALKMPAERAFYTLRQVRSMHCDQRILSQNNMIENRYYGTRLCAPLLGRRDGVGRGGVRHHLVLSLRIDLHVSDRQALAELAPPALGAPLPPARVAQAIDFAV